MANESRWRAKRAEASFDISTARGKAAADFDVSRDHFLPRLCCEASLRSATSSGSAPINSRKKKKNDV